MTLLPLAGLFVLVAVIQLVMGLGPVLLARRRRALAPRPAPGTPLPRATLIIPCDGQCSVRLGPTLEAYAAQDWPGLEVVCATRRHDPEVAALARSLHCTHLVAGDAAGCCQKNHNLLAGVAAAHPDSQLFVFCDADARPDRRDWLRDFLAPLLQQGAHAPAATTTFRRLAAPKRLTVAQLFYRGYADIQLSGLLLFGYYVWGGATALRRDTFEALGVRELWSRSVVDDITLAMRLRSKGLRARFLTRCMLEEPPHPERELRGTLEWAIRQNQYMQYVAPDGFWGGLAFPPGAALAWLVLLGAAVAALPAPVVAAAGLACFTSATGQWLRVGLGHAPARLGLASLLFNPLGMALASWAGVAPLLRRELVWGGVRYRVGKGGRVLDMAPDTLPPAAVVTRQAEPTVD